MRVFRELDLDLGITESIHRGVCALHKLVFDWCTAANMHWSHQYSGQAHTVTAHNFQLQFTRLGSKQ